MTLTPNLPVVLVVLLAALGCKARERTEIVVEVDSDLDVPSDLDKVLVQVDLERGKIQRLPFSLKDGTYSLPIRVGLLTDESHVSDKITVTAAGLKGDQEEVQVGEQAMVSFLEGQSLLLRLYLARECRGDPCRGASGKTCTRGGQCVDIQRPTLPPFNPDEVAARDGSAVVPRDGAPAVDAAVAEVRGDAPLELGAPPDATGADTSGDTAVVPMVDAHPDAACAEGETCMPGGNICLTGRISCAGGLPACMETGQAPYGKSCGVDVACSAGRCLPIPPYPVEAFRDAHYFLVPDARTWPEARDYCERFGLTLVSIGDEAENAWLASATAARAPGAVGWHIGLGDAAQEGTFVWQDGSSFLFQNWAALEPNNGAGGPVENCVGFYGAAPFPRGTWNDITCDTVLPFICKQAAPPAPACPSAAMTGPGLRGDYFAGMGPFFSSTYPTKPSDAPVYSRVDEKIDFMWGDGSPGPNVPIDFAARWTGRITPRYTEPYTFAFDKDDTAYLWIDGRLVLLNEKKTVIALQAGHAHDLRVEFIDFSTTATVRLHWQSPSQAMEIVPASSFSLPCGDR
jgi:hypothetical protein